MEAISQFLAGGMLENLAFLIALLELIIGLYIALLNLRNLAYRYAVGTLLILALNTYAVGQLQRATDAQAAYWPTVFLAATFPVIMSAVMLTTLALFFGKFLQSRWGKRLHILVGGVALVVLALTLVDLIFGTRLYFTPLADKLYPGGYVDKLVYTGGALSSGLTFIVYGVMGTALVLMLAYTLARGNEEVHGSRLFAGWLLAAQLLGIVSTIGTIDAGVRLLLVIAVSAAHLVAFSLAAFGQGLTQQYTRGSLQTRLTLLALAITLPLLAAMGWMLTNRARDALENDASATLSSINQNVVDASEIWLSYTTRALRMMVADQAVISMGESQQTPILRSLTATYPDIFLAGTVNTNGRNVARSDGRAKMNYAEQQWFNQTINGLPVSYQVTIDTTTLQPALVVAMPIRDSGGRVLGVGMISTQLTQIQRLIRQEMSTGAARVLIVNNDNKLIAASESFETLMSNLSDYPPVAAVRSGVIGPYHYTDELGERWISNVNILSNGWGVVVQEPEAQLFAPVRSFQNLALTIMAVGALALLLLTWQTMRQAMQPVRALTETAAAITAGDLNRDAPVSGEDELGMLAESFNKMTGQLRELISSLENRVEERTRDLERRAVQLQVTADVARGAALIHDPSELLPSVVQTISERFDFYHAGIFLLEGVQTRSKGQPGQGRATYAVLRAASSEGGQRMLRRGHRLAVGQEGIVGYVASTGESRVALDVGRDAVYFNNPDLPMTRSELALPLRSAERVIGVLDVQSTQPSAFAPEDVSILQTLADQLAVAIENANLIDESQQALRELETLYGMQLEQGWQGRLGDQPVVYRLEGDSVRQAPAAAPEPETGQDMEVPILLRGVRLGALHLRREPEQGRWTAQDQELARETVAHMAQALENARLVEEIRTRAHQEEQINQIVARTQGTLGLDGVMRTAVQELVRVVNASRVQIRMGPPDHTPPELVGEGSNGNGAAGETRQAAEGGEA